MPRRTPLAVGLTLSMLGSAAACAGPQKLIYTSGELRSEVARRAPSIPRSEVVVPFEIDEDYTARARRTVAQSPTDADRTRALAAAFLAPDGFHMRYAWGVTRTAQDTLRTSEGNCLALASAFVGLARAAGLQAYYIDASTRVHETRYGEAWTVNSGHVTAMVQAGAERIGLDFGRMGYILWYRIIDDVEALAHFYNNRGFEVLESAEEAKQPEDWSRAARDFRMATQVMPDFARAWNNLGIAESHLGRTEEAMASYRTAIRIDPRLAAPRNNLGSLYLQHGRIAEAVDALEAASRLDAEGSHIQYNLALALVRKGDRSGAVRALERAIQMRGEYPEAKAMLDRLAVAPER